MEEIWKDIPGWAGYQVSDMGNVRTFKKQVGLGLGKGVKYIIGDIPKIMKPQVLHSSRKGGHLYVTLSREMNGIREVKKVALIHRLVLSAFVGPCPDGKEVRHDDGNPTHNWRSNLFYGTHSENMQDAVRHGTQPVGELARDAKLKEHQVIEIRERYASGGITQQQLADEYGVGHTIIGSIINRKKMKQI